MFDPGRQASQDEWTGGSREREVAARAAYSVDRPFTCGTAALGCAKSDLKVEFEAALLAGDVTEQVVGRWLLPCNACDDPAKPQARAPVPPADL